MILEYIGGAMKLSAIEAYFLHLYRSDSAAETAEVLRDALPHICEPDVCDAAESLLGKLEFMGGAEFDGLCSDWYDYAG
jgi:hypothetical protein